MAEPSKGTAGLGAGAAGRLQESVWAGLGCSQDVTEGERE